MAHPTTRSPQSKGCVSGCLIQLVGSLVVGSLVVLLMFAVFEPWAFHLGGEFHALGYWQGWGTIHAPEGDYVVFMRLGPWMRGRSSFPSLSGPAVRGSGAVCSPRGEKYAVLRLSGGFMNRKIGTDTNGESMNLNLSERLNFLGTNSDTRLNLGFRGRWRNPDLVLDDHGSLRRMFNTDGSRWSGDPHKRPEPGPPLELVLHPGSMSDFDQACAEARSTKK